MDCAKAAGARIVKPRQPVAKMRGILRVRKRLPLLVAVPTTAGTGSETTLAAVITDSATHYKYPINDFPLIPRVAVLDYRTTLGLPKQVTSTTGIDALVHAVEAYIGRSTTKETRANAENAVRLIRAFLKRAYDDGSDAEARAGMLHAAFCAGAAFTKSYVGYVHGVAHSLGGQYGIPHGLANAVVCPYVLDLYGASCHKRLGALARAAGVAPLRRRMPRRRGSSSTGFASSTPRSASPTSSRASARRTSPPWRRTPTRRATRSIRCRASWTPASSSRSTAW